MTTQRPITFPKTNPGEWTNRETGVTIIRMGGGYRPFRTTVLASIDGPIVTGTDTVAQTLTRHAARPLCLRADGGHVTHMAAVVDGCRVVTDDEEN